METIATDLVINIITAAVIFAAGLWISKYIRKLIVRVMTKKNIDIMLISFSSNVAYIGLIVIVIIATLSKLGIQTTSLIAIIGAAGLAVGLALQSSLSNFASGIMIIFFRPFRVGDFIDAGGVSGIVEGIHIFSTLMRTGDNKAITVPNSKITGSNITNFSAKSERRIDLVFGISYDDDIRKTKRVLQELLDKDERILKEPAPIIAVSELGNSSVNLIVRPWVKTDDYWPVYWDLMEAVKLRFDEENITIPYPQQDVYLHQAA